MNELDNTDTAGNRKMQWTLFNICSAHKHTNTQNECCKSTAFTCMFSNHKICVNPIYCFFPRNDWTKWKTAEIIYDANEFMGQISKFFVPFFFHNKLAGKINIAPECRWFGCWETITWWFGSQIGCWHSLFSLIISYLMHDVLLIKKISALNDINWHITRNERKNPPLGKMLIKLFAPTHKQNHWFQYAFTLSFFFCYYDSYFFRIICNPILQYKWLF